MLSLNSLMVAVRCVAVSDMVLLLCVLVGVVFCRLLIVGLWCWLCVGFCRGGNGGSGRLSRAVVLG